jgi:hypothetical protein
MSGTWDFKTDRIVQTTFFEALEKLTDSDLGWRVIPRFMSGNCSGLIISAEELARIRAACQRRACGG